MAENVLSHCTTININHKTTININQKQIHSISENVLLQKFRKSDFCFGSFLNKKTQLFLKKALDLQEEWKNWSSIVLKNWSIKVLKN